MEENASGTDKLILSEIKKLVDQLKECREENRNLREFVSLLRKEIANGQTPEIDPGY